MALIYNSKLGGSECETPQKYLLRQDLWCSLSKPGLVVQQLIKNCTRRCSNPSHSTQGTVSQQCSEIPHILPELFLSNFSFCCFIPTESSGPFGPPGPPFPWGCRYLLPALRQLLQPNSKIVQSSHSSFVTLISPYKSNPQSSSFFLSCHSSLFLCFCSLWQADKRQLQIFGRVLQFANCNSSFVESCSAVYSACPLHSCA